ncbi:MAG: hypothetical protein H7343_21240 [Undibacterium sp.]|nr:hypothetical protein [Opitutaceae bacterium]
MQTRSTPFSALVKLPVSFIAALLLALAAPLSAQPAPVTPGAKIDLTTVKATDLAAADRPIPTTPLAVSLAQRVALKLKWNDAKGGFSVTVQNPSDRPLKINGVQSSGDLFIVSYPPTVPPQGTAEISTLFDAKPGTGSDADVIRLLTDQGEKTIIVTHDREKVATLSQSELVWAVGEAASAKSTVLTLAGAATKLTRARAMAGATATISDLGGGRVQVSVTPRSTAALASFPVFLEFEPALPGATPVITCTVGTKG